MNRKVMRLDRLSIGCVLLLLARSSHGEFHSLPDWYFYGGANSGSWSGSSTSPSNAQLTVTMNFPMPPVSGPYATAVGQSSASVVQIESHTTYNFTFHAWLSAAAACEALTLDDDGSLLWTSGKGHPDAHYYGDIDPVRPGMELAYIIERGQRKEELATRESGRTGVVQHGHAFCEVG